MDSFTIPEAKERLEDLPKRAALGEDVRITDPALGTVRLEAVLASAVPPFELLPGPRRLGHLTGKLMVPARLMEPMDADELKDWYGDDA
jgi:hypothetical protein